MLVSSSIQERFDQAQSIVFLTGAGVSTLSGIPDYRSKNGIYQGQQLSPEYLLSAEAFATIPLEQYRFMQDNMYFPQAQPNIIHQKMAAYSLTGRARVITQNIDDLDLAAGIPADRLIRFHGSLYDLYVPKDGERVSLSTYQTSPYRPRDQAFIRPNITFYGEQPKQVDQAFSWVSQADLVVIVGTSFQVYPFASLLTAASPEASLLAVNLEALPMQGRVDQVIGDAGQFFTELKIKS